MSTEADRIRAEYARRRLAIPAGFYSRQHPANLFARHGQERAVLMGLRRAHALPLGGKEVLEIGCGDGDWLGLLVELGASPEKLAGIDLDAERISAARQRWREADLRVGDASRLPWPDRAFDLVAQSTVFSSILDAGMRNAVACEMARVLKPGGVILWYDFFVGNPSNPGVRGMRGIEIRRLFPGCEVKLRRATLAPPIARLVVPRAWLFGALLEALRVLDTHYIGVLRKHIS